MINFLRLKVYYTYCRPRLLETGHLKPHTDWCTWLLLY